MVQQHRTTKDSCAFTTSGYESKLAKQLRRDPQTQPRMGRRRERAALYLTRVGEEALPHAARGLDHFQPGNVRARRREVPGCGKAGADARARVERGRRTKPGGVMDESLRFEHAADEADVGLHDVHATLEQQVEPVDPAKALAAGDGGL